MKRFYLFAVLLFVLSTFFVAGSKTTAQSQTNQANFASAVSQNVVISQFQTAGSSSNDEFIELHNVTSNNLDLNGLRLVYRSAGGTNDVAFVNWTSSTIIAPGGYYLIASVSYDDSVAPNITYNPTACSCSMALAGGGLAIRSGDLNTGTIIDSVAYGTATNAFKETSVTAAPSANAAQIRANNGCQDTDNNANDFSTVNPSTPRNNASSLHACDSGGGTNLLASGAASPTTIMPGGTTLLTVSVLPAENPPSTGIQVFGNLQIIGGAANQQFFDDGTHGDQTANDNIFTFSAVVSNDANGGVRNIAAIVSDAQSRAANVSISLTINAPIAGEDHLLLGNPSFATTDAANENNYLMLKPQYAISYNRSRAIPNWVSWRLDSSWIGSADRQDDFRPDPQLPANWYHVTDTSYSGSGFDRGHHTPSGDRTRSAADNSATFLMTNMMPQAPGNNQGPWEKLESYSRTLATQGNELYIVAGSVGVGGVGSGGSVVSTIDSGRITVPAQTWKVIVVLPNGDNDLSRINSNTRTIAVIMPNVESIRPDNYQKYLVSIDQVESLTGYDFFSNVPTDIQAVIESRVDGQTNAAPTISAVSGISRQQGNPISNSQIATVNDADQTLNSLQITVNGGSTATINGVTVSNITVSATGGVTADIFAAKGATAANFTLRVTDSQGSFSTATLNVGVATGSYEADVDPRPNQLNPLPGTSGDGVISSGDVMQIRRFALGLDKPDSSINNEFQKADCAPFSTFGDGIIAAGDVTQARRYAAGLDNLLQPAAGPTTPAAASFSGNSFINQLFESKKFAGFDKNAAATLRTVTPVTVSRVGNILTIGIVMNSAASEISANALSFTLNYNPAELSNPSNIRLGSGGGAADVNFNNTQSGAGQLGVLIDLPPQQTFNSASQQLLLIDFTVAIGAPATTSLGFGDVTTPRFISDTNGNRLDESGTFMSAIVTVAGPKSRKRVRF